ncbi:MAG TPA: alcohol dehydrogenase catalytic domain-containing protein [Gammaproteobacteria bacterium]|nr:alcohol dehydrogenase catalytic domain-containing protein [Gammaproteobacteria bacterium]
MAETDFPSLYWALERDVESLENTTLGIETVTPPGPYQLVVAVEAATICSSDIKVIKLGDQHPLFSGGAASDDFKLVLGHELCLRVVGVGAGLETRFRVGQRLGLQPTIRGHGDYSSQTVGMDIHGGFCQYLKLDERIVAGAEPYVFEVPEDVPAAVLAMLEPYACVERAYRPNARTTFATAGTCLIYCGAGYEDFHLSRELHHDSTRCIGGTDDWLARSMPGVTGVERFSSLEGLGGERFDDIVVCGDVTPHELEALVSALAKGGVLVHARKEDSPRLIGLDPARIHYHGLSFFGTSQNDIASALHPARQRYDVTPGGVALVHGAGGPMGRIHVHRLLQLADGPETVVATSRSEARRRDLVSDFDALARRSGCSLVVTDGSDIDRIREHYAPDGFTDVAVAAPSAQAVDWAAGQLADDGMLIVFAGMPFGSSASIDLGRISSANRRITGSTSCSVDDEKEVLARIVSGELDPTLNLKAVTGLGSLGRALSTMINGEVSGKIAVFPQVPDMPLRHVERWTSADELEQAERWRR